MYLVISFVKRTSNFENINHLGILPWVYFLMTFQNLFLFMAFS